MIVGIALLNLINFDSLFHAQYRLFRELKSSVEAERNLSTVF